MTSFKVNKADVLNKAAFLEEYLENYSKKELKKGEGIESSKIDEDELVELSEEFEETQDTDELESITKSLHKKMDLNSDGTIDNDELAQFSDILDEIGLSSSELLALYSIAGNKVSSDVNTVNSSELEDIDLDEFKELLAKYPKLSELVEEVGYDTFFDLIDTNSDGVLSSDELKTAGGLDEDSDNLSYSDIKKLLKKNDIEYTNVKEEVQDELDEIKANSIAEKIKSAIEEESNNDSAATAVDSTNSTSSAGTTYSSGGTASSGSTSSSSSSASTTSVEDEVTIEDLEEQKAEKTEELTDLNSDLSAVYDGSDEEVASAKEDMDAKKEEYDELLASEAETNEEVKALKEEADSNQEAIDANDEVIAETELALNDKEQEISSKENEIAGLESEKTALEACLADAKAITITEDNEEEIQAKIADLEAKISAKEEEIETANEELEKLEEEKTELETALEEANAVKEALEAERDAIEEEIKNAVSEKTKLALEAYQTARTTYETTKETRASEVKSEIQSVQDEINEIEVQIQELKAAETVKENKVSGYGEYNEERGEALAAAAESLYGNVSTGSGLCATGVADAIEQAFGYRTHGNGCDYGETMSALDDWVEITDEINSVEDLQNLPAGAVVSWSAYNGSAAAQKYGHVYITDGKGNEISDFKTEISSYYFDHGSECRVFLPT